MNRFQNKELIVPNQEQPYEKIERLGPKSLTDAELLAIILRTGSKNEPSIDTARKLLSLDHRGLGGIHVLTTKEMRNIKGIGKVKSIQLKAVAEISTRLSRAYAVSRFRITSPKSIANIFMEEMRYHRKEHIKVVFLDTKNGIIMDKDISVGTVNASLVDPRDVFLEALKYEAVNIILLHNHPSGDPEPSVDDIEVTKRVFNAGKVVGIELLDHIIIGDGVFTSMKEEGLAGLQ